MALSSVDALIHHPLLVMVHENVQKRYMFSCRARLEDLESYQVEFTPALPNHHVISEFTPEENRQFMTDSMERVVKWFRRRKIQVFTERCEIPLCDMHSCALLDLSRKSILPFDMIAEWKDRLTLIILYHTIHGGGFRWKEMLEYARKLRQVCKKYYALDADVLVMNVYGKKGLRGKLINEESQ